MEQTSHRVIPKVHMLSGGELRILLSKIVQFQITFSHHFNETELFKHNISVKKLYLNMRYVGLEDIVITDILFRE